MSYFKNSYLYFLLMLMLSFSAHANDESPLIKAMQSKGHILMLRHAIAPGFGDPDDIEISDCSTQRNLDEQGREQSKQIGQWLKRNSITPSAIYSSQWCRCLDTANLLDLGEVKELPALNSFFQMTENREPNLKNLKQFISEQHTDKNLIVMVTHSVTISAIAGQNVASGDGVLLKLNKNAPYEFISAIIPDIK